MALPKEPRQKMINMMYIVLVALLALNVSAEILNAFKIVDQSLVSSSMRLSQNNSDLYRSLDAKLTDEKFADRAKTWQPIASEAGRISNNLYSLIEQFKGKLRMEASARSATDSLFKEDNLDAASRLFAPEGRGEELFSAVARYKDQVLRLHPELKQNFETSFPLQVNGDSREWLYKNFNMVPTVAALTILSKLQNDVRNAENQVVNFCNNKISQAVYIPDSYGAIITQSSDYFMPGGKIRIQGSVGAYSKGSGTTVLINGVPAQLNASGVAEMELPAGNTGEHAADVTVSYLTQEGKPQTETRRINWTVGAPGGTAVMLDKLDILYMGVPNPVTIAAGVGEDKVNVNINQGTITRRAAGGKFEVNNLSKEGDATISVVADGKTTNFPFRVRLLPLPTAYVGTVKDGYMPAKSFIAMKGVRAELADAPINAPYVVVSYDIAAYGGQIKEYVSSSNIGPFWTGNAANIANRVSPGTTVTISKIMVKGPEGKVRPAANPVIVIKCT